MISIQAKNFKFQAQPSNNKYAVDLIGRRYVNILSHGTLDKNWSNHNIASNSTGRQETRLKSGKYNKVKHVISNETL
jgi:hypothetical protein